MSLRIGSLCTGYGGLDDAVQRVFGGELAWVSDIDPGACKIIAHHHPTVPNLGDLTAVDWAQVEPVDIVTGGYPCQPFSLAGDLRGTDDERHIWPDIARALGVLRPRIAVFENVANHLRLGFDTVLCDLARLRLNAEWSVVRADEVGAPHKRRRLIVLATAADAPDVGHERGRAPRGWRSGPTDHGLSTADPLCIVPRNGGELSARWDAVQRGVRNDAPRCGPLAVADPDSSGRGSDEPDVQQGQPNATWGRFLPAIRRWERVLGRPAPQATDDQSRLSPAFVEWMMGLSASHVTAVPGLPRTQQLKALGNGVVPQQAEAAIRLLYERAAL